MILEILRRTPLWVYGLFAALLVLGLTQVRTRRLSMARLFALPIALTAYSLYGFISAYGLNPVAAAGWAAGVAAVTLLVMAIRFPGGVTYADHAFTIPGSWIPLAVIMAIFFSRYVLTVAFVMNPALKGLAAVAAGVGTLYGLSSGFFVGRTLTILRARRAPAAQ